MIAQKKVEIVINKTYLRKILEFLEQQGVKGYTVIEDALGLGERGLMRGDEITDTFKNSYVFTVCDEETANRLAHGIVPYLKKYGGVCFISDVLYVVH
ncbi:P-II family nitrogen regulator [Thermocrinis sp.]|uniref:P-II family nitrogen regulator n=1 Tax=Thermocrinis sp. TaxID=2024383 RepID=UPI002FDEF663